MMFADAVKSLSKEFALAPNTPGGMVLFRQALCTSFFFKFYTKVTDQININKVSRHYNLFNIR